MDFKRIMANLGQLDFTKMTKCTQIGVDMTENRKETH